jgi:hypothetical protein
MGVIGRLVALSMLTSVSTTGTRSTWFSKEIPGARVTPNPLERRDMRIKSFYITPKATESGVDHRYGQSNLAKAGEGQWRLLSQQPWDRLLHAVAGLSDGNGLPRLM